MSLELILNEELKDNRYKLLSSYLKNNFGVLSLLETEFFKQIFENHYTPADEDNKFQITEIISVEIQKVKFGQCCFNILVEDKWYPVSIKRLAGQNVTNRANLIRSLRNAIEPQIQIFKINNPLNSNDGCPIEMSKLGDDAQVDHKIPFNILAKEWLKSNTKPIYIYDASQVDYVLQEPFYSNWGKYHNDEAILRWVSKNGNKYAHKLYKK